MPVTPMRAPSGWGAEQWAQLLAAPRRYGWHATLRAPWRLAPGCAEDTLLTEVQALAREFSAFELPALRVRLLDGFAAICLEEPCEPLRALANQCVIALQPLAARLTAKEFERYDDRGLTGRQQTQLSEWGYPYVLEDFRFHMTLTGPLGSLAPEQRGEILAHAEMCFAGLPQPLWLDALSVFVEPQAGSLLRRVLRVPLSGSPR